MRFLLIAAFILSGAAGLIYESVWTRYLGLFVGHTAYAQIIVLAVFLGGMAIGAGIVSRYSERIKFPLVWYACVELGVALGGFVFHFVFRFVTNTAYDSIFPALGGVTLQIVKWGLAALLILPQSILLGATFPLMSAGYLRLDRGGAESSTGRTISLLYFANSIGAAVGVLIAGFYLLRIVGLPGTLASAALTNLLAAGTVFVVAGWVADDSPEGVAASAPPAPHASFHGRNPRAIRNALWLVAAGTAISSFIYEIAWVRMLSLVLGAATHSFELMLSAFILGLSLGALAIRKRADSLRDPLRTLAIVQWVMGVLALGTIPLYLASYQWTATLLDVLNRTDSGYTLYTWARYAFCLVVMLPATFCAGMTLPLITRTAMSSDGSEADIGRVYGINTLGSIVGAALAGLVLIPALNLKGTLVLGAAIDMLLGIYIVARFYLRVPNGRRLLAITGVGGAIVVANAVTTQHFDRGLLTSGVYRYAVAPEPGTRKLAFYRDGRTATVSVRGDGDDGYSLATNGKPDASLTKEWLHAMAPTDVRGPIGGDQVTQAFLPIITLAYAPHAANGAVIGFGSGVSSHILLGSPEIQNLFTIEIEPSMAMASRIFHAANGRVYDDSRSTIVFDDAKSYFAAAGRKFDLIMSEPSNPWVSGVSGLFTDEFYTRVKKYLKDDGVFGQWLHLYEIDDPLVLSVMAAIHKNFASYDVYFTSSVDVLIVASPAKQLRTPDWNVIAYPKIAEDLMRFRPLTPALFEGLRVTNRATLAPLIEMGIPPNSDFHPYLDLGAEKTRFMKEQASGFIGLGTERFPIGLALSNVRTPFGTATETAVEINRTEALALGASLKARVKPARDAGEEDVLPRARHRADALRVQLAGGAPDDWNLWLSDALTVDLELHNGTIGVADEQLYSDLFAYTAKYGAPERISTAIRFMHAMSVQDWAATDSLGNRVIEQGEALPGLAVNGDLLRDAIVVANIERHDIPAARKTLVILQNHGTREKSDLRTRLLEAWVQRAEKADSARKATSAPKK